MAINLTVAENDAVTLGTNTETPVTLGAGSTTVVTVNDYEELRNKPSIEGVELEGDKTFEELNLQRLTNAELENMLTL